MTVIIRYQCEGCGQLIANNMVQTIREPFTGEARHYCPECYKEVRPLRPALTQQSLRAVM